MRRLHFTLYKKTRRQQALPTFEKISCNYSFLAIDSSFVGPFCVGIRFIRTYLSEKENGYWFYPDHLS
jgi:hypothetical protein